MYQTFTVLLIFCFTTGFGLEEYGCTLDENYGVQHDSDKDIKYPVWGKKTSPVELTKNAYNELIEKIKAAKKTILDQYLYDETQVTTLFSEYKQIMSQGNKSFNKAEWEQFHVKHSLKMDSRRDELGLTMKVFNQLFHSLSGSRVLDPEVVKKASYFAAVTDKKMRKQDLPKNKHIHDSIGVIEMLYEGQVIYMLIHPYMGHFDGGAPVLSSSDTDPMKANAYYSSFKGLTRIVYRDNKLDVKYDHIPHEDTIYTTRPLCSFTYTAKLKINDPVIILGKCVKFPGLDSYIMTSVDGTGSPHEFCCKEMSKEQKFCIGYYDVENYKKPKEKTFGSVKEMTEEDEQLLRIVADRMNNTFHPVTFDKLMSKLTELDTFVEAYRKSTKGYLSTALKVVNEGFKSALSKISCGASGFKNDDELS